MKKIEDRPTIDVAMMNVAHKIKERSEDLFIQHGCVIIHTKSKHIISTGFNGLIPGAPPEMVDRTDREARRPYMQHAEKNAVLNCTQHPLYIGHCTAYVTGKPCFACLQDMVTFGIKRIVYDDECKSYSAYDHDQPFINNLLKYCKGIKLVKLNR